MALFLNSSKIGPLCRKLDISNLNHTFLFKGKNRDGPGYLVPTLKCEICGFILHFRYVSKNVANGHIYSSQMWRT